MFYRYFYKYNIFIRVFEFLDEKLFNYFNNKTKDY